MTTRKIHATITISRPSYHDGRKAIRITINDQASRIEFLDAEISMEDFAECLTGHGHQPIEIELRGMDVVGKTRVRETRTIEYTGSNSWEREVLEQWLQDNAQEEGWIIDHYLGSQSSIDHMDGKTFLNYSVHKYVEL